MDDPAEGDLNLAHQVAQAACEAAPFDEICCLDLIKVTAAGGHDEAAAKMLNDSIANRTDDYLPAIELPKRTGEIVGKQQWGRMKHRSPEHRA